MKITEISDKNYIASYDIVDNGLLHVSHSIVLKPVSDRSHTFLEFTTRFRSACCRRVFRNP